MERQRDPQQKTGIADPVGDEDAGGVAGRDRPVLEERDE